MKDINIGMAGFGGIAKTHIIACYAMKVLFSDLPFRVNLQKVYRRNGGDGREIFNEVVNSYDKMIDDPNINLISICTPNNLHFEQSKQAIAAGKNVYCEKPIGLDYKESRELAEKAARAGVMNQTAFIYRFIPAVAMARDYIRDGKLGEILNFRFVLYHSGYLNENRPISWRLQSEIAGAGAIVDLGIHMVDCMRYMLGEVKSVQGYLSTYFKERYSDTSQTKKVKADADEHALLNICLMNGARGTAEVSRIASNLDEYTTIEVYGTMGSIKISSATPFYPFIHDQRSGLTSAGEYRSDSGFYYSLSKLLPPKRSTLGWFNDAHLASLLIMFMNMANGKVLYQETPTFGEAAAAQKIIDMALLSSREDNRVVIANEIK